jgi:hypoxanthine phosphoribosyltransferase
VGTGREDHESLTWGEFGAGARALAQLVRDDGFAPSIVLAIARGGLPLAGAVSYSLGVKNCCVINVEYYTDVDERLEVPAILPPALNVVDLTNARVLVVDDVADTGETLKLVADQVRHHVAEVRIAVLYEKPRSAVRCDYVWRQTSRWIDFPWSALGAVTPSTRSIGGAE